MIGTIISDRYKIIDKVGSGGFADVYLAQDLKLQRKVAIKILSEVYASDKNFVIRFKREAQILARLNDQNIVSIFDWGSFNSSYFICMEYVEGLNLHEIIERWGIINPYRAARYAIQICNGLEVAHKNNLIHRDIKPQNIIVTKDGVVKITDFGIAKLLIEDSTKTLNILGTSYYISPEQAQGKLLNYSSDLYSLGIVIYEMLTADVPFRGGNSIEISLKHVNEKPIEPSMLVPTIPRKLSKIVMHCLEKNPAARYESVSALKADLINFIENKPLNIEKKHLTEKKQKETSLIKKIANLKIYGNKTKTSEENLAYESTGETLDKKNARKYRNLFYLTQGIAIPLIVIFLTLFIINFLNYNNLKAELSYTSTPEIINMSYQSAQNTLSSMDLKLLKEGEEHNESIPEDFIISQSPASGVKIKKNSSVKVITSLGPEESLDVIIPNLIGLNVEETKTILENLGLNNIEIEWSSSDYFPKDIIINQSPSYGKSINLKDKVVLEVSSGKEPLLIPNVEGYDLMNAVSQLEAMGLNVLITKIPDKTLAPGIVKSIYPPAGTEVNINSNVTIYISTSQDLIQVPDLTNMSIQDAKNILDLANIPFEISYTKVAYDVQKDIVLQQFPQANNFIFPNESIMLVVGN
jgi:serine/threonine-protein kinase